MKIINNPSLANCNLLQMGEDVRQLVEGGAPWFHVDLMDGHYVPNLCFPLRVVSDLKAQYPQVEIDVHLMVTNPMDYLPRLKEAGADWVSFHLDATNFSRRTLTTIRAMGMKAGIIINPSQRIDALEPILDVVDYVVLMSVEPGYAGQKFMPEAIPRLAELVELRRKHGRDFLISVDGAITKPAAVECAKLGAEVFVTGIYTVFQQELPIPEACRAFEKMLCEAVGQETVNG